MTLDSKSEKAPPKLTAKQQRFCEGIAEGKTGTQAAKDAGYSERSAYSIAHENLNKPELKRTIDELKDRHASEDYQTMREVLIARLRDENTKARDIPKLIAELRAITKGATEPERKETASIKSTVALFPPAFKPKAIQAHVSAEGVGGEGACSTPARDTDDGED